MGWLSSMYNYKCTWRPEDINILVGWCSVTGSRHCFGKHHLVKFLARIALQQYWRGKGKGRWRAWGKEDVCGGVVCWNVTYRSRGSCVPKQYTSLCEDILSTLAKMLKEPCAWQRTGGCPHCWPCCKLPIFIQRWLLYRDFQGMVAPGMCFGECLKEAYKSGTEIKC